MSLRHKLKIFVGLPTKGPALRSPRGAYGAITTYPGLLPSEWSAAVRQIKDDKFPTLRRPGARFGALAIDRGGLQFVAAGSFPVFVLRRYGFRRIKTACRMAGTCRIAVPCRAPSRDAAALFGRPQSPVVAPTTKQADCNNKYVHFHIVAIHRSLDTQETIR